MTPYVAAALLAVSGCAALSYEVLWMRRFALLFGSGPLAVTLTVTVLFGGLGLGGLLAPRLVGARPGRRYALLEASAAGWALLLPTLLGALTPFYRAHASLGLQLSLVLLLAGPPAVCLGATFPLLARSLPASAGPRLYAANTAGAVLGVLAVPALLLPLLGVTGSERAAATLGLCAAALAWTLPSRPQPAATRAGRGGLVAVALSGFVAMALELAWTRLAAVLVGPSVHAFAWVLAVFLGGVALGALLGRRSKPHQGLGALGLLALLGCLFYARAPMALALLYEVWGPGGMGLVEALLAALCMAGAPLASGAVFGAVLRDAEPGRVYGVNTLAGVLGSLLTGLWLLPWLGVQGVVTAVALLAALGAGLLGRSPLWPVAALALVIVQPRWDGQLYAVGVYNRVADLGDRSPEGVASYAHSGWELLSYEDGRGAAVAVGQGEQSGNIWLSINGKVDASTGDDMPTQRLSGELPLAMHPEPRSVLVVGLASGVTAGAVLESGVEELVVVELEEEVVAASRYFEHVNGKPLEDPRTELRVADARAVLTEEGAPFDVIISEPSNPWITGVSNLFTVDYWELGRQRLGGDGIFCQWIQLYGLALPEFRSIVRSFTSVFPRAWLFEALEGGDLLMIGSVGEVREGELPLRPLLGPEGMERLGRAADLNTDDRPGVELAAPRSIHLATVEANRAAIARASR